MFNSPAIRSIGAKIGRSLMRDIREFHITTKILLLVGLSFVCVFLIPYPTGPRQREVDPRNAKNTTVLALNSVRQYHQTGNIEILREALKPGQGELLRKVVLLHVRLRERHEEVALLRELLRTSPALNLSPMHHLARMKAKDLQLPVIGTLSPLIRPIPDSLGNLSGEEYGRQAALCAQAIRILVELRSPESETYIIQRVKSESDPGLIKSFLKISEKENPPLARRLRKLTTTEED